MFVSDRLIYLDLQKTASTQIVRLLQRTTGGELRGRHGGPQARVPGTTILGSIRNPWDWYVSLWAFGCAGQGRVFRTSTRLDLREVRARRQKLFTRRRRWREVYADADDPALFRRWLAMLHDPRLKAAADPVFARARVSRIAGFLTWRFLRLYTEGFHPSRTFESPSDIRAFYDQKGIVDVFIRTENLHHDLVAALETCGHPLTESARRDLQREAGRRGNASAHRDSGYYYDAASADLVARRDALVVERFGYSSPVVR